MKLVILFVLIAAQTLTAETIEEKFAERSKRFQTLNQLPMFLVSAVRKTKLELLAASGLTQLNIKEEKTHGLDMQIDRAGIHRGTYRSILELDTRIVCAVDIKIASDGEDSLSIEGKLHPRHPIPKTSGNVDCYDDWGRRYYATK